MQAPASLKAIQHYLKIANEYDSRDGVISYYCRLYAVQKGISLDSSSPEAKKFLFGLMDSLEKTKTTLSAEEGIQSEVVGQAHVEDQALRLFQFADNEDRAGRFSKQVVKSFYTAGMLFDTLAQFGDISEDIDKQRAYAKWKATYIHKCLKSGETPIPGPMPDAGGGEDFTAATQPGTTPSSSVSYQDPHAGYQPAVGQLPVPPIGSHAPPSTPAEQPQHAIGGATASAGSGRTVTAMDYEKVMKYCKFATSACQYEDKETAIENLRQALALLES